MSEKFRLDPKIDFQNTFYTKCINVIIDSIGPSNILRSIDDTHMDPRIVHEEVDNLLIFFIQSHVLLFLHVTWGFYMAKCMSYQEG